MLLKSSVVVYSIVTCMLFLNSHFRSLVLVIMLPIIHSEMDNDTNTDHLNQTGFIIITILQLLTVS